MSKKVNTPRFDGTNYKRYKKLVKLWEKVTDIKQDDRGAALILCMSGGAMDIALAIDSESTTVKDLLEILDKVYIEENNVSLKFDEFDRIMRPREQNMREFIHIYEEKSNELKADQLILPDLVLANKLLRAANLLPEHYLLARSTCGDMTMENAKKALLRISEKFTSGKNEPNDNFVRVKQEVMDGDDTVLYSENDHFNYCHNEHYGHESPSNEILFQSGKFKGNNPYIRNNSRRQCFRCGENSHILKDCPGKSKPNHAETFQQCYGCGDTRHWIKDCPYLKDIQNLVRNLKSNKNTLIAECSDPSVNTTDSRDEMNVNEERTVVNQFRK